MDVFGLVIQYFFNHVLSISLTYGTFTFTLWEFWLSIAFLGICIFFIKKVFD